MPLIPVTCLKVRCDTCHQDYQPGDRTMFFTDQIQAFEEFMFPYGPASDSGWRRIDGRYFCGDCEPVTQAS